MTGALALQLLMYGVTNGAVVALNALGFTLAYAVSRQINLAHGNVFALATVVVASLAAVLGIPASAPLAVRAGALVLLAVCGAACGALLNTAVEQLAFRPFRRFRAPLGPLIATVGLSFLLLQVAIGWRATFLPIRSGDPRPHHGAIYVPMLSMPELVPAIELGWGGVSFTLKDAVVVLLGVAVALGVAAILARTRTGRLLRAVAQDPELAALVGGDPARAQTLAFALAGALAGFGAAIFAAYYGGASLQHGLSGGLAAITAAVLGGVGNPRGAFLGGLALGIFGSFSDYLLDAQWTPVLLMVLLVGLLAFRPHGLLAHAEQAASEDVPPPLSVASGASRHPATAWLMLGLLVVGVLYPWVDQLAGWSHLSSAASALLLVTLAVGLNVVVGFAGMLDLGYAAFFAIGGYTAALLTASGSRINAALPALAREPWVALPTAALVAAGFGLAFGVPTIRARGEYLAVVTLAFGAIVPGVLLHVPWTGGPLGMSGVPLPQFGLWGPSSPLNGYALALVLAVLACAAALRLAGSRTGRAWAAVREDELAAAAVGVNPPLARLLAFAIGAGCAGLAGAVYAGLVGSIEPGEFDFTVSLMVLAAVVIGARWGVAGVAIGALVVAAYDRLLVGALEDGLHALGATLGVPGLLSIDVRGENFAVFGLALYLATLAQLRGPAQGRAGVVPVGRQWRAWPHRALVMAGLRRPPARG